MARCGRGVRKGCFNQKDPDQPRPAGGDVAGRVEKETPMSSPREGHPKRKRSKCPEKEMYLTCTVNCDSNTYCSYGQ